MDSFPKATKLKRGFKIKGHVEVMKRAPRPVKVYQYGEDATVNRSRLKPSQDIPDGLIGARYHGRVYLFQPVKPRKRKPQKQKAMA